MVSYNHEGFTMWFYKINLSNLEVEELKAHLPEHLQKMLDDKIGKTLKKKIKEQERYEKRKQAKESHRAHRNELTRKISLEKRQSLIDNQTHAEKLFKAKLKAINIAYEFKKIVYTKRSFYILDFYLPDYQLVIELDGKYHEDKKQKIKDNERTEELKTLGFTKIKRFSNDKALKITDLELKAMFL